ncbi:ABC transporter permease [Paenibacillus filicis]|uniref:ABC transporter permease n=1 Tax=Paenibacillus filicis TaxID=669464 RepID=A0ABU9DTM9_9BACL
MNNRRTDRRADRTEGSQDGQSEQIDQSSLGSPGPQDEPSSQATRDPQDEPSSQATQGPQDEPSSQTTRGRQPLPDRQSPQDPQSLKSPPDRSAGNKSGSRGGWGALVLFAALLLLWELGVRVSGVSTLVLPAPSVVAAALGKGLGSGYFIPHIAQTVLEIVLGLLLGGALGLLIGVGMGEWSWLRRLLSPYVIASQAVPKLALAPLFMIWFGFGTTPKVVITALIAFFPLLESTVTAIQYVDPLKQELFRVLGASRWQTLLRLKLPAGLPGMLAGVRVAVVLAVVGAVVGEFIGGSKGLGALLIASQGMMDTPLMFAVLLLLTVLGMGLYQLVLIIERIKLRPYKKEKDR